jgi:hypothetical protein
MNTPIAITADEAKVVASLLEIYYAVWEEKLHINGKHIQLRTAMETAGDHQSAVFESLEKKVCKR